MGKGLSIAGFVLSIVGTVLGFLSGIFSILGLPVAVTGLVLSVVGGKKLAAEGKPKGLATAGLVLGIISVVLTGIAFFTCGLCTLCIAGSTGLLGSLF